MTAEIAVMNKFGVALAADSAVTISLANGGTKIYNSVNKLFMLSKCQPVGIMIYGGAELVGIPWEVLIKGFREELGAKSCGTVNQYLDLFKEFLRTNKKIIGNAEKDQFVARVARKLFQVVKRSIIDEVASRGASSDLEIKRLGSKIITTHLSGLQKVEFLESVSGASESDIRGLYKDVILDQLKVFENYPFSAVNTNRLVNLCCLYLVKQSFLDPDSLSGVVVAGYGTEEYFPSLVSCKIEGVVGDVLRSVEDKKVSITASNGATIVPFAQSEEVNKFMNGIHPGYYAEVNSELKKFGDDVVDQMLRLFALSESEEGKVKTEIGDIKNDLFKAILEKWRLYERRDHIMPVVHAVSFLPKDEIAAMAESLINLTSFRHRVSTNDETVGGPIDVAVISRGDGFVWIKRKHYFESQLNHHFFSNYFCNQL